MENLKVVKIDSAKKQLFDQLMLADIVLCSTPYLLDKCLEFNDNCHLRENYIPIGYQQFQPEYIPVQNRKPTIGICGSLSHYDDWMSIRNQFNNRTRFFANAMLVAAVFTIMP